MEALAEVVSRVSIIIIPVSPIAYVAPRADFAFFLS